MRVEGGGDSEGCREEGAGKLGGWVEAGGKEGRLKQVLPCGHRDHGGEEGDSCVEKEVQDDGPRRTGESNSECAPCARSVEHSRVPLDLYCSPSPPFC